MRCRYSVSPFFLLSFLGLFLAFRPAYELHAQYLWEQQTEGLEGAYPISLITDAHGNLVLSTSHGIYLAQYDEEMEEAEWHRVDTLARPALLYRSLSGRLFAHSARGIYTCDSNGLNWHIVVEGSFNSWAAIGDSTIVWYDMKTSQLMVTPDLGRSIRVESNPATPIYNLQSGPDGQLYTNLYSGQVRISRDTGRTWEDWSFKAFTADGNTFTFRIIDTLLFVVDGGGILRSADSGITWQRVDTSLAYNIYKGDDGNLYGFEYSSIPRFNYPYAILRSTDAGLTWKRGGSYKSTTAFAATINGELWTGGYGSVFRSGDHGTTWYPQNNGLHNISVNRIITDKRGGNLYLTVNRVSFALQGTSKVISMRSLHRSTDNGTTWTRQTDTLNQLSGIDSVGNLYCVLDSISIDSVRRVPLPGYPDPYRTDKILVQSRDLGRTWRKLPMSQDEKAFFSDVKIHSNLSGLTVVEVEWYDTAHPAISPANTFFLSTNSGAEWGRLENPLPAHYTSMEAIHVRSDGTLLIAGRSDNPTNDFAGVWRCRSSGENLVRLNTVPVNRFVQGEDGSIYAFHSVFHRNTLAYSEDEGETWQTLPLDSSVSSGLIDLKVGPDGTLFALAESPSTTLFRSTDRGGNWQSIVVNRRETEYYEHVGQLPALILDEGRILDTLHFDTPGLFAAADSYDHYYGLGWSDDKGESWNYDRDALNLKHITSIVKTPDGRIIVGTMTDGLFREVIPLSVPGELTVKADHGTLRVLPTPAFGNATAAFNLEKSGVVRLELFDLLGRSVSAPTVRQLKTGEQNLPIDLQGLSAGSYLLRLTVEGGEGNHRTESIPVLVR